MFQVVEKVDGLRVSGTRHKLMTEIDELINCPKVFTLYETTHNKKGRCRTVICELYNTKGDTVKLRFVSSACGFVDSLRNINRQLRAYIYQHGYKL